MPTGALICARCSEMVGTAEPSLHIQADGGGPGRASSAGCIWTVETLARKFAKRTVTSSAVSITQGVPFQNTDNQHELRCCCSKPKCSQPTAASILYYLPGSMNFTAEIPMIKGFRG